MGVAASIVSAVLKSIVGDKLGSGLAKEIADISIDGISEKGINEITDFINGGKSKIDSILSNENMKFMEISEDNIDYVVTEIKELLSKIDITDEVFRQCKYDSMNLSAFLWDKYRECKNDYIECESEIKRCLFAVAEALIKLVRESENFEKDVLIQISNSVDEMRIEEQIDSQNIMRKLDRLEESNQAIYHKVSVNSYVQNIEQKIIKSRTQEYADKWDANMFLNDFNKRDENAGINVKLSEVYLGKHLPHYKWGNNKRLEFDLKSLLSEYVYKHDENNMLLILGQPGIGKSTLVTWIIANFVDRKDSILIYKFASDLKNIDWNNTNFEFSVADQILNELHLSYEDLNGKTLIIDGFDEINVGGNREKVLNQIYWQLIKSGVDGLSLIITCRENYIRDLDKLECTYITLQTWNETQITSFCKVFQEKSKNNISEWMIKKAIENKEVFGIPLILYMVVALNISIEKEGSIVDVYDKIFSLEGGIYDRCINNKSFADKHRIGDIKKQIHQISREIALWMFENNPEEAYIPQEEYQKICDYVVIQEQQEKKEIESDFLIGNFFKLVKHCEGIESEELYFVHRSIYEYFMAETIFSSVENSLMELSDKSQEEFAKNISGYLWRGQIEHYIEEYLKYKILKLYNKLTNKKKEIFFQWWEKVINKMMSVGMFYYTKNSMQYYKNVMIKETQCFANLIKILMLVSDTRQSKYIAVDIKQFEKYIKYCSLEYEKIMENETFRLGNMLLEEISLTGIKLMGVSLYKSDLSRADLSRSDLCHAGLCWVKLNNAQLVSADLSEASLNSSDLKDANLSNAVLIDCSLCDADLRGAKLIKADLRGANLTDADLEGANLADADLRGARFEDTKLNNANLEGAIFDNSQVMYLDRKYNMQKAKVYVWETEELMPYEEYYNSR